MLALMSRCAILSGASHMQAASCIRRNLCALHSKLAWKSSLSSRHLIVQVRRCDKYRRYGPQFHRKNNDVVLYATAAVLVALGASYAAVPLYRIYCQSTGKGGRAVIDDRSDRVETMQPVRRKLITVKFEADTESQMAWMFKPTQSEIKVSFARSSNLVLALLYLTGISW